MRLQKWEVDAIKECAKEAFGDGVVVRLFGSRVDESRRGGDIDLYVTPPAGSEESLKKRSRMRICLQERLGEQKIDIVVAKDPDRAIERIAMRDGVVL